MSRRLIEELSAKYSIRPSRRLGQNFLVDEGVAARIVESSGVSADDIVLEIGPGLGIVTRKLIEKAARVVAVEIDSGLVRLLNAEMPDDGRLTIVHADFLKADLTEKFTRCVANLPYYCSSEILFTLATRYGIPDICVMLQKEMAARITSQPGSPEYGALTVSLGLYYTAKKLFNLERRFFFPQPDIVSSFIAMRRRGEIGLDPEEISLFHRLVRAAFWGRRKMLATALSSSPHITIEKNVAASIIEGLGFDVKIRGEELGVDAFSEMARRLKREGYGKDC